MAVLRWSCWFTCVASLQLEPIETDGQENENQPIVPQQVLAPHAQQQVLAPHANPEDDHSSDNETFAEILAGSQPLYDNTPPQGTPTKEEMYIF